MPDTTSETTSLKDKKKIRPLYSELQGCLSQAPTIQEKPYLYEDEANEWEQVNTVINELHKVTGTNTYDRFRVELAGGHESLSTSLYRTRLGGLISYLHGEFFSDEPPPFSGMPGTVINHNLSQHQSQQQTITVTLLELQSKIDKKLAETTNEKERSFLQQLKDQLSTIISVGQLIQLILSLTHQTGLDPHTVSTLLA